MVEEWLVVNESAYVLKTKCQAALTVLISGIMTVCVLYNIGRHGDKADVWDDPRGGVPWGSRMVFTSQFKVTHLWNISRSNQVWQLS